MENLPARTYEIVWADGRREELEATRVETHWGDLGRGRASAVEFWGPLGLPDGTGWCGRLLLVAVVHPSAVVSIRDIEATRPEFEAEPPSWWQRLVAKAFWSRP